MSYDLSFEKKNAVLLAILCFFAATLLVAAGYLLGMHHRETSSSQVTGATRSIYPSPDPPTRTPPSQSAIAPVPSAPAQGATLTGEAKQLFSLQLGAFKSSANADAKVKELKEKGVTANVVSIPDVSGHTWFAVRYGSYETTADAIKAAAELRTHTADVALIRPANAL